MSRSVATPVATHVWSGSLDCRYRVRSRPDGHQHGPLDTVTGDFLHPDIRLSSPRLARRTSVLDHGEARVPVRAFPVPEHGERTHEPAPQTY
jgi:hypothetical protein